MEVEPEKSVKNTGLSDIFYSRARNILKNEKISNQTVSMQYEGSSKKKVVFVRFQSVLCRVSGPLALGPGRGHFLQVQVYTRTQKKSRSKNIIFSWRNLDFNFWTKQVCWKFASLLNER